MVFRVVVAAVLAQRVTATVAQGPGGSTTVAVVARVVASAAAQVSARVSPLLRLLAGSSIGTTRLARTATEISARAAGWQPLTIRLLLPEHALVRNRVYAVALTATDTRGRTALLTLHFTAPGKKRAHR